MTRLQEDEFSGSALADFWDPYPPSGGVITTVVGGQLSIHAPGPAGGSQRLYYPTFLQKGDSFDLYGRMTLPHIHEVGPNDWVGGGLECWGNYEGFDTWFEWSNWYTGAFDLTVYADGWTDFGGGEWVEEYVRVTDILTDPENLTLWIRFKWPGSGLQSRHYYSAQEPTAEEHWTEIPIAFTRSPDPTFTPDGSAADAQVAIYGGVQNINTPNTVQWDFFRNWPRAGFKSDFLVDLDDVFYNLAEFAENVIYLPRGGSTQSIKAVILDQDGSLSEGYALADTLNVRVRVADVYQPGRDAMFINGEKWNVLRNVSGGPASGEWELEISRADKRVI